MILRKCKPLETRGKENRLRPALGWHQACNISTRNSKLPAARTGDGAAVNQLLSADRYFLSEIWCGDSHYGIRFAESKLVQEVKMRATVFPTRPKRHFVAMK
ncbi:MAG: hypothetical protein ACHP8B_13990 [Terriglobales bacterium]